MVHKVAVLVHLDGVEAGDALSSNRSDRANLGKHDVVFISLANYVPSHSR